MTNMNENGELVILGAGNFGTCLAQHLANQGQQVLLYAREDKVVNSINHQRVNPTYLSNITLSPNISAFSDLSKLSDITPKVVLLVIPTQFMREILISIKEFLKDDTLLIAANKGIEVSNKKLPIEIIADVLGKETARKAVFLSGPSFASEVANKQPTAVSVASNNEQSCLAAQRIFHASHFRTYTSHDPIGLEVAGALKNVMAIAAGACAGIGFEQNSLAALLTRALAEITRVGIKLGANPLTFQGLGGVGDLFLTCSSSKSRNYSVGFRLGKGESIESITNSMVSVAEGVATSKAAKELITELKVDAPIICEVYSVIYEGKPIERAVTDLLTREAKHELDQA